MTGKKVKVFLTGAGGRTGRLVLEKLRSHPKFEVVPLVRREEHLKELGSDVVVGDVRNPESFEGAMGSCDRLVMYAS